jgi:hypothetical protein
VATLREVAAFFGVAVQTAKQWRTEPEPMPGKPGAFNLSACVRWRIQRERRSARQPAEGSKLQKLEEEKLTVDLQTKQTRLELLRGALVETDEVTGLFERAIHEHNSQADQLKERLLVLLPDGLAEGERTRIVQGIERAVNDLRLHLADAAEQWAREQESESDA